MIHSAVWRVIEAVGSRTLPVRPGDMLFFPITQERMLIVCSTEQSRHVDDGTTGQYIAGIRGGDGEWWWENAWLNWDGLDVVWTIHRTS